MAWNKTGNIRGLSWQFQWSNVTAYTLGQAVSRLGSSYLCLNPNTGIDPATDTHNNWTLLASKGDTGAQGATGATPPLSNATPQPVGGAAAGTDTNASRDDHKHEGPKGLVAWNSSVLSPPGVTATDEVALTTTAVLDSSRMYEIHTSNLMGQSTIAGDYINLFIRQSAAGGAVGIASTLIGQNILACPVANAIKDDKNVYAVLNGPASGTYQFGLCLGRSSGTGTCTLNVNAGRPMQIFVKDIGPATATVA